MTPSSSAEVVSFRFGSTRHVYKRYATIHDCALQMQLDRASVTIDDNRSSTIHDLDRDAQECGTSRLMLAIDGDPLRSETNTTVTIDVTPARAAKKRVDITIVNSETLTRIKLTGRRWRASEICRRWLRQRSRARFVCLHRPTPWLPDVLISSAADASCRLWRHRGIVQCVTSLFAEMICERYSSN